MFGTGLAVKIAIGRWRMDKPLLRLLPVRPSLKKVASAILADGEPWLPARRKKRRPAGHPVKWGVSASERSFPAGRMPAFYGRRDARRYIFRQAL
jgi:hypothetical protein